MNIKLTKALSAGLAAAMLIGSAFPVMAAEANKYTPIAGESITMDKILVMDKNANVPNTTFNFTIAPASAGKAATADNSEVLVGPAGVTIGTATFAQGQTTYDTVQKRGDGNRLSGTTAGASLDDHVTLEADQKYAKSPVTINMTGITFDEPGVYRYAIAEVAHDATNIAEQGITNDEQVNRYLDVYVEHDDADTTGKTLKIAGYVLHNTDEVVAKSGALAGSDRKDGGYTNTYETHDLTLSKAVTGNQASHDKFFKFTVAISNANPNTVYDVDITNAVASTGTANAATNPEYQNKTNAASLTVGADGTITADYYLQHGQSIIIKGLGEGTKYTVTETPEDYTPRYVQTEGAEVKNDTVAVASDTVSGITEDTTIAYTNTRTGTIPTGIVLSLAPYLLIGCGAAAGVAFKRKKEDDAEA